MNIDFNVANYSIQNIQDFLNISNLNFCSENEIIDKINILTTKILNSNNVDNDFKNKFTIFVNLIHIKLKTYLNTQNQIEKLNDNLNVNINHPLQSTPEIQVINAYDYKYPVGLVNPVERRIVTKLLCIDTLFRDNYNITTSSNFTYVLPSPINNVIKIKITSVEIPNFGYVISSAKKNNTFTVELFNITPLPDNIFIIIIPDGNYTPTTMISTITTIFNNIGHGLQYLSFIIDEYSNKTIICANTATLPDTLTSFSYNIIFHEIIDYKAQKKCEIVEEFDDENKKPKFKKQKKCDIVEEPEEKKKLSQNLYKSFGWLLGFKKSKYEITMANIITNSIITYIAVVESESSFGNSISNYLFVDIDDYQKNFTPDSIIAYNSNNSYVGNNILARIRFNNNFNNFNNLNVIDNIIDKIFKEREYFGPIKLEKLNIRILDKFGEIIDFNNNDISLVLEIQTLY